MDLPVVVLNSSSSTVAVIGSGNLWTKTISYDVRIDPISLVIDDHEVCFDVFGGFPVGIVTDAQTGTADEKATLTVTPLDANLVPLQGEQRSYADDIRLFSNPGVSPNGIRIIQGPVNLQTLINNNTVLTANNAFNTGQTWFVTGQLNIDANYTMNAQGGSSEIIMCPGSSIIVNAGMRFFFNGGIIRGCGEFYDRISTLDNAGASIRITNSQISFGQIAVEVGAQASLQMWNNDFIHNVIGTNLLPNSRSFVTNNRYDGDGVGFAGVRTRANGSAILSQFGGSLESSFHDLQYGVFGSSCAFTVDDANFDNIYRDGVFSSAGTATVTDCSMEDITRSGVYLSASHGAILRNEIERAETGVTVSRSRGRRVTIIDNYIATYDRGIHSIRSVPLSGLIEDNVLEMDVVGVENAIGMDFKESSFGRGNNAWQVRCNTTSIEAAQIGVRASKLRNSVFQGNYVDMDRPAAGQTNVGYQMIDSPNNTHFINVTNGDGDEDGQYGYQSFYSPNANYACNSVDALQWGMTFIGDNNNTNLQETTFENFDIGLDLSPEAVIGRQFYRGNKWIGGNGAGQFGARHLGIPDIVDRSRFDVNGGSGSLYNPFNFVPLAPNAWIYDGTGNNASQCQFSGDACGDATLNFTRVLANDTEAVQSNFSAFNHPTSRQYYAQRQLLSDIDGQIAPDTGVYSSFVTSMIGSLAESATMYSSASVVPTAQATLQIALSEGLLNIESQLDSIVSLYDTAFTTQQQLQWETDYSDYLDILANHMNLLSHEDASVDSLYDNYSSQYTQLPAGGSSDFVFNTDVSLLELEYAMIDSLFAPPVSYSTLADGCPSRDGAGVYVARAELRQPLQRSADTNCGQSQQLHLSSADVHVSVTPNPMVSSIEVALKGFSKNAVQLEIRDLLGRVAHQATTNETVVSIDVSKLPAGTYYLQASDGIVEHTVQLVKI